MSWMGVRSLIVVSLGAALAGCMQPRLPPVSRDRDGVALRGGGDARLDVEWLWAGGEGQFSPLPSCHWCADGSLLVRDPRSPVPGLERWTLHPTGAGAKQPLRIERERAYQAEVAAASLAGEGVPSWSPRWPQEFDRSGRRALELIEGDVFVLELDVSRWRRLTRTPSAEHSAQFSPDGRRVSYVRENDLYFYDLVGDQEFRLTTDGDESTLNGTLSWVYWEEIFGRRDIASWWSEDSRSLAFLQTDESAVETSHFVGFEPWTPELIRQRYPKAGGENPRVRVGVVSVEGGAVRWLDLEGIPHEYVLRVQWLPDHQRLAVQVMNRAQTQVELWFVGTEGRPPQQVLREEDAGWVNLHDDLRFLDDGQHLLWQSERTGYAHLYRHRMDGELRNPVTQGSWAVRSSGGVFWMRQAVAAVDEAAGWLYFTGQRESALEKQLYRVRLDGTGMQRISEEAGTHRVSFSPDARYYLDTFASRDRPPSLSLRSAEDGRILHVLAAAEMDKVAALDLRTPQPLEVRARDGFLMPGQVLFPRDFDPRRRHPVVLHVYGGPSAPTVANDWEGRSLLWDNILSREGMVVVKIDNRSATARSKILENSILEGMYGDSELNDLLDAVDWLGRQEWVDRDRIGLWGWSGGGTYTLLGMTRSDRFRAGIAVAAVTDWRYYDSKWAESVMKRPEDNPEGYAAFDLNARAADLHGRLLLVHGTYDDNVHPANCWKFVDSLVAARKPFDLMMYPMRKHGIADTAARIHLYDKMLEFWKRELVGAERAGESRP